MNVVLNSALPRNQIIVEYFGWVLVHSIWQFALIAMLVAIVARVLHRNSSALQYGVLVSAMALMVSAPILTWVALPATTEWIKASREALASGSASDEFSTSIVARQDTRDLSEMSPSQTPGERQDVSPPIKMPDSGTTTEIRPDKNTRWADAQPLARAVGDTFRPWLTWIVVFWGIGVLVCSLRPLLGWRTLRRLRRIGISAPSDDVLAPFERVSSRLGLKRAVQVLNSTLANGPLVVGYLRPVVLLPVSLVTSIPMPQLEAILAHELAHIRRHDFVINLLQTLIETLFFYHPAVWWLSHRIRIEREHCCDDLVIKHFNNAPDYGRALLALEQLHGQTTSLALGATDGSLLGRIRRIVSPESDHVANRSWLVLPLILCLCSVASILAIRLRSVEGFDDRKGDNVTVPAIAELPGRIEVELIGVGFHPSNGKVWWRPDGSEQTQQPDVSGDGSFTVGSDAKARENCREFLLQIRGLPKDHSIRTDYGARAATGSSFKNGVWTGYHGAGPFKDPTTNIKLSIATVPYGPVVTIDPGGMKNKRIAFGENLGSLYDLIAPVGVHGHSSETGLLLDNVSYSKLRELAEWELHAVDTDGVHHRHHSEFVPDMPNYPSELIFQLPIAKISRFEYRLRPYRHFVTFENVSLDPAQKSNVIVSVKSLPSDIPQAFVPNGATIQLLGVSTLPNEPLSNEKRDWWSGDGTKLARRPVDSDALKLIRGGNDGRELVFCVIGPGIFSSRIRNEHVDAAALAILGAGAGVPMFQVHEVELFQNGKSVGHLDGAGSEIESEFVKSELEFPSFPRNYDSRVYDPGINEPCIIHTGFRPIGDADTANVQLRVETRGAVTASYDPKGKLLEVRHGEDPVLRQAAQKMLDGIHILRAGPFEGGFAIWTAPFASNSKAGVVALQLCAVDKNLVKFDGIADGNELRFTFSEPPENVETFNFIVRPYTHVITFENVSLKPEQQTDIKVSVESSVQSEHLDRIPHNGSER